MNHTEEVEGTLKFKRIHPEDVVFALQRHGLWHETSNDAVRVLFNYIDGKRVVER